ncbi:MAG TPA: dihydrofolate reductase family protein [Candidatus Saccharimonadales bacterium]|nr:dihydrofolate reductase family protein [Candidatus Saccharimonadales bacterium]
MKVSLLVAMSADGRIGADKNHLATAWTTHADKVFFTKKTKEIGTLVMGLNTFKTFGVGLKGRRLIVLSDEAHEPVDGVEFVNSGFEDLVERLKNEGVQSLAICGGSYVYSKFIELNLVDEIFINVMPTFLGDGIPFIKMADIKKLRLVQATTLKDDTVQLHYLVEA